MDTITAAPAERQAEALRVILAIGDMVHAAGDLADLMERAVEAVVTFTGYASCAFFELDEPAGVLRALSWRGFSEEIMARARTLPVDGSLTGRAVRSGEVVSSAELAADARLEPATRAALGREGFTEAVSVPVLWRGRAIGALNVIRRHPAPLDPVERSVLLAIGKTVGVAMANRCHLAEIEAEVRQRRAAERELGLFRFAVERAADALALVRDDGAVAYANPALLAAIGRASADGLRLADLAGAAGPLADLAAGGQAPAGMVEIVTRDGAGTARIQEVGVSRLELGGEGLWCLLMRDVTAHRRQELELREARDRAQAADRAKGQFLANMSHELRTPLNGILGLTELLIDEQADPAAADRMRAVHRSGQALLAVINDVLDFARAEAGALALRPAPFDPVALLSEVAALFRHRLDGGGVELLVHADGSLPPRLVGDAGRIRQVLASLVGNAVKFTERGHVLLSARWLRAGDACTLELGVADTGPGIAPGLQRDVFRPFVQADGSDTRRHGGAGLGLPLVRSLVGLMGGTVALDSVPGRGTAVTVALPAASAGPAPPPAGPAGRAGGRRVLVADDSPVNRSVAAGMLRRLGAEAEQAADGAAAVARVAAGGIDLVLMDLQMPVLDGFAATAAIRAREGGGPRLPVLALTACLDPVDRARCEAAGMDGVLAKPLTLDALRRVLGGGGELPADLDAARVDEVCAALGGDRAEFRARRLDPFRAALPGRLAELDAAVRSGDPAALERVAHALAGAAQEVGALALAAGARGLIAAMRAGDAARALELLAELRAGAGRLATPPWARPGG